MANNRYIQIDKDTAVGYNYLKRKYYVTNKNTTTYRNTAEETMAVLEAIKSTEIKIEDGDETIVLTAEYLEEHIYQPIEILDKIYYTLEDNGAYIRTLQFNDWVDYPLTVDCEEGNIFIKNTNVLYSLNLDDSPENKILRFCSYYLETLGLEIERNVMTAAFNLLAQQYKFPYFYTLLYKDEETNILKYAGAFNIANYNNLSPINCSGARNPNGEFDTELIGNIKSTDSETNTIYLQEPITPNELLMIGAKITIEGTSQEIDGVTYSSDGTYTISNFILYDEEGEDHNEVEAIQVAESLTSSYEYPYPTCYVQSVDCPIYSMERENKIIKVDVSHAPSNLLVGDTIYVENAQVSTTHEIIDLSGAYTVQNISNQIKQILDVVLSMGGNTIVIYTSSTELKVGDTVQITGTNTTDDSTYTITNITENSNYTVLTVLENIPYIYGNYTSGSISVTFETTTATNILKLPASTDALALNPQDLVQVKGTGTDNDKLFTITQVTRNVDGSVVLALDSTVVDYEGTATLTFTFMNPVTLTGSTILYYNIYVEEEIATDYTSSSQSQATFYKEVFVNRIIGIDKTGENDEMKTVITLEENPEPAGLTVGDTIYIYLQGTKYTQEIYSIDGAQITLDEYIEIEMPVYPITNILNPSPNVLVSITSVQDYLEDIIPTGDFIVDDFEQCQDYIKSLNELDNETTSKHSYVPLLPESVGTQMYQELEEGHTITIENLGDIELKGLYSEVYSTSD